MQSVEVRSFEPLACLQKFVSAIDLFVHSICSSLYENSPFQPFVPYACVPSLPWKRILFIMR